MGKGRQYKHRRQSVVLKQPRAGSWALVTATAVRSSTHATYRTAAYPRHAGGGGRSAVEQADQHKIYALISLQKAHNFKSVFVRKNQPEAVAPTRPHEI